jgi:hypothetical protein
MPLFNRHGFKKHFLVLLIQFGAYEKAIVIEVRKLYGKKDRMA